MTLASVAALFMSLLKNADPIRDPLYKHTPGLGERVEPEMTEELDELVKDSLHLVILLQRAFQQFRKESSNEMAHKLVDNALIDLEDIEEALTNPELLNFDLNLEAGLLDTVDQNASMLKGVLDMLLDNGKLAPEFKGLDLRVFKWINELIENTDKLYDKAMGQSSYMEGNIADRPMRMVEQDERDVDQIDPEEIHPDYDDPDYLSGTAYENAEWRGDEETVRQKNQRRLENIFDNLPYWPAKGPLSNSSAFLNIQEMLKIADKFNQKIQASTYMYEPETQVEDNANHDFDTFWEGYLDKLDGMDWNELWQEERRLKREIQEEMADTDNDVPFGLQKMLAEVKSRVNSHDFGR